MFSIIGVRIRKDIYRTNPNYSINQFALLDNYLSNLNHNVICIGDFNVYWAGTWNTNRNFALPKTSSNYTLYTPPYNPIDGFSYVEPGGSKLQLDHLITNIKCKRVEVNYDWDFINNLNGYGNLKNDDYKNIIGIPDHAILKAKISI